MNRRDMRSELAYILSVREGEADQDFQTTRLNKALDKAYERCVLDGRNHGTRVHFELNQASVWPADATTLVLSAAFNAKELVTIYDITEGEPGIELREREDFTWLDRNTLQWQDGSTGPGDDVTLRIKYLASAEDLASDASVPLLVPPEHCMYIVWEAALYLRGIADDEVPNFWRDRHNQARVAYIKHVSRPRPDTSLALALSSLYEEELT